MFNGKTYVRFIIIFVIFRNTKMTTVFQPKTTRL